MARRIVHNAVVFLCGTLLVLPVGWCCLLPSLGRAAEEAAPAPCCCQHIEEPTDASPSPEHNCPSEPNCCCSPQSALLKSADVEPLFFDTTALFTPFVAVAISRPVRHDSPPASTALPLYLLHSVWLC